MKNLILSLLILKAFSDTFGQVQGCNSLRYLGDINSNIKKQVVKFGSNKNLLNLNQDLYMNLYTPENDGATRRPVIMFVHGGSFYAGDKTDMDSLCITYARKGYVTATPDYRLFPLILGFPDSAAIIKVSIGAMYDVKAAMRYLRQDAATTNVYKIDPDNMIIGGISAGSIIALNIGQLDSTDIIPTVIRNGIIKEGGFEGNSGNPSYNTDVVGIVNMSGAVFHTSIIDKNDPPVASIHGTIDDIVPIGYGKAGGIVSLYGSDSIVAKLNSLGTPNAYTRVIGAGHIDLYLDSKFAPQLNDFLVKATVFMKNIVCKTNVSIDDHYINIEYHVSPNPTQNSLNITAPSSTFIEELNVFDITGRHLKQEKQINSEYFTLNTESFQNGIYFLQIRTTDEINKVKTVKFVIEK